MKPTVTMNDFVREFDECNRSNNYSPEARRAMYNYFIELEADCGCEIELDAIAICCDYTEYESIEEFQNDYSLSDIDDAIDEWRSTLEEDASDQDIDWDYIKEECLDAIRYHTTVIEVPGSDAIVIQQY